MGQPSRKGLAGLGFEFDLDGPVLAGIENLAHVPRNCLAFAVGVGREEQAVGAAHRFEDRLQMFFGLAVDLPRHRKIRIRQNRAVLRRQIADMAVAGDDLVVAAQILVDGLRLGGRFDDDDFHQSALWRKVAPAGQLKWVRNQSDANIQRKETRLPGWRSTRPASSSSRRRVATAAADKWHWRTSSSTATGVGPNLSVIRSSAASSATGGGVPADGQSIMAGRASGGRGGGEAAEYFSCAPSCDSTSSAPSVRIAPCRSRSFEPRQRGSSGEPGTAKTSRPCSSANRAVISEPERAAASTTTTPRAIPEISRLRRGKCLA